MRLQELYETLGLEKLDRSMLQEEVNNALSDLISLNDAWICPSMFVWARIVQRFLPETSNVDAEAVLKNFKVTNAAKLSVSISLFGRPVKEDGKRKYFLDSVNATLWVVVAREDAAQGRSAGASGY